MGNFDLPDPGDFQIGVECLADDAQIQGPFHALFIVSNHMIIIGVVV